MLKVCSCFPQSSVSENSKRYITANFASHRIIFTSYMFLISISSRKFAANVCFVLKSCILRSSIKFNKYTVCPVLLFSYLGVSKMMENAAKSIMKKNGQNL